jgi:malonyl-CoA O-methyltransferase
VTLSLDDALPEKRATRRAFDAADGFEHACFLHDDTRSRLLARLDYVALASPRLVIDVGCATGRGANGLALRYPGTQVLALDTSSRMLRTAVRHAGVNVAVLGGDAERLPIRAHCVDLMLANLVLPWCRPDAVFAEAARVLKDGGLVLFATLGPDTLKEVREAFGAVDRSIHVHAAFDMHHLGDMALAAGLAEPVLDVDRLEVTYPDLGALVRELRAVGAVNVAGARRRGLTGVERWRRFERGFVRAAGRLAVTVELIFGQAFGLGAVQRSAAAGPAEIRVPIERLKRRSENT